MSEVVVAVSFPHVAGLTAIAMSEFWRTHLATAFPKVEEHPPYVSPIERFEPTEIGRELAFEFSEAMPAPRIWFISSDGQQLVQLQRDWLACNWRKVRPEDVYGRWPSRRKAFVQWFTEFQQFAEKVLNATVNVTQCEVTYVNQIEPNEVWRTHSEAYKVLKLIGSTHGKMLQEPEQVQVAASYVIPNDEGKPVGRLHVTVQPAIRREDKVPIFVVNLTARGNPEGDGLEGALKFLDRGRAWIVRGFADLTTPEIQNAWGIENA